LPEVFGSLRAELEAHIRKEEAVLFSMIAAYEHSGAEKQPLPPTPFGTVEDPIRVMEAEHESAGEALASIRDITNAFEMPAHACPRAAAL
jgi:regulator of cell morphogenesis and NO signaling